MPVSGVAAGPLVEVLDEGPQVSSDAGSFADEFGELAIHIYKLRLRRS